MLFCRIAAALRLVPSHRAAPRRYVGFTVDIGGSCKPWESFVFIYMLAGSRCGRVRKQVS